MVMEIDLVMKKLALEEMVKIVMEVDLVMIVLIVRIMMVVDHP